MFAVDTNVLVYASDRSFGEHARCRDRLEGWRRQAMPWFLTWNVLYEYLRVVTHPKVLVRPWSASAAWGFVQALLASPALTVLRPTERHDVILAQTLAEVPELRGNLLFDTHTAVLLREHGVRQIVTRDIDFARFGFLEVVDPLA
ncbi:MAG: PIN domain-containing protein [Deltaproteobacteria bacterium]|nr:PIN domain-containing protein [Deltaproteobacteria bacterium]